MLHNPVSLKESDTVYALRDRITVLEAMLGLEWLAPVVLRLTPTENDVLGIILAGKARTQPRIFTLLYGNSLDPPDETIITVYVSKLRRKLRPFGINIETRWGYGWHVTPENQDKLNALYGPGER